jgi:copper ion binding protein
MTQATLTVPEISCAHCKQSIEEAVAALAGIESVAVDIEPRTVDLVFDESTVGLGEIKAAIEAVGYAVPDDTDA